MLDPEDLRRLVRAVRRIGNVTGQNPLHILPRLVYLFDFDREGFKQLYIEIRDNPP